MKLILMVLIGFAFLSIFGLMFVIRAYRELKKQYQVIESQNKEIAQKNYELAFINESLEEINLEKNNVISVVAHDLKAPLGNMQGLVELIKLQKERLSEDQLNYLEIIKKVSQETGTMVDIMLDVHRIESELHELTLHPYNIVELLHKIIRLHEPAATQKKIKIEPVFSRNELVLHTDKQYCQQILSNIVDNAVTYSPENSVVEIGLEDKTNTVLISIKDSGPGISESDQKRLFTGYNKFENKNNGNKSTGIGLVIVHKLLEKLHGKLDIKSKEGIGSTFIVELPK